MGADETSMNHYADAAVNFGSAGIFGIGKNGGFNRGVTMRAIDEIDGVNYDRQSDWQKTVTDQKQAAQDKQQADLLKYKQQQDVNASNTVQAIRNSASAAANPYSRVTGTARPLGGAEADFLGI